MVDFGSECVKDEYRSFLRSERIHLQGRSVPPLLNYLHIIVISF
jgi:hypothetical protein